MGACCAALFSSGQGASPSARLAGRLSSASPADIGKFEPRPDELLGRVVSVYDGDTVTLLVEIGGSMCKISVRVVGVDAPEMRGRGAAEAACAQAVRAAVVRFLGRDALVHVDYHGTDKYGRVLADIIKDGESLSKWRAEASFALMLEVRDGRSSQTNCQP